MSVAIDRDDFLAAIHSSATAQSRIKAREQAKRGATTEAPF